MELPGSPCMGRRGRGGPGVVGGWMGVEWGREGWGWPGYVGAALGMCVCSLRCRRRAATLPWQQQEKRKKCYLLLNSFYTVYVYSAIPRYMWNTIFFIKIPNTWFSMFFIVINGIYLPAWCVYTHWHRGKTEKGKRKKRQKNTIFNEHPVAHFHQISLPYDPLL